MIKNCLTCKKQFKSWNNKQRFCSIFCFHEYPRLQERSTGKKICNTCLKEKSIDSFYIRTGSVHKGLRGSCKVCEIEKATKYAQENYQKIIIANRNRNNTVRGMFNKYRTQAHRFGKVFLLDIDFFEENKSKPCFYCGTYPESNGNMGVDRIDSKIGYIKENCVPCCRKCNLAKFTYSVDEFIKHVFKIVGYQRSKNEYIGIDKN